MKGDSTIKAKNDAIQKQARQIELEVEGGKILKSQLDTRNKQVDVLKKNSRRMRTGAFAGAGGTIGGVVAGAPGALVGAGVGAILSLFL